MAKHTQGPSNGGKKLTPKYRLVEAFDLESSTPVLVPENEAIEVKTITGLVSTTDGFLWTPAAARQMGFGWSPFKKYPAKIDDRVVALADYLPPGQPSGRGGSSDHWIAIVVRADGVQERLTISCMRDAHDDLFEFLDQTEIDRLEAPFVEAA